jgi:hypothetical protein
VLVLCIPANAFGSDGAQLEAGTGGNGNLPVLTTRATGLIRLLIKERRFIPLQLDAAPIIDCCTSAPHVTASSEICFSQTRV